MRVIRGIISRLSHFKNGIGGVFLFVRNYVSSVIFNFTYLPFSQARYLPIWVNRLHFSKYAKFSGLIRIDAPHIYPRMIKLGIDYVYWYPENGIRLMVLGTVVFKGKCMIGNNSTIYVKQGCTLTIGDNVQINANSIIICEKGISIGDNSRIGWNCLVMDTDFHYMKNIDTGENTKSVEKPIIIGRNNWISSNCSVFKGFKTADYITIGSGTKCRGSIEEPYTIWANEGKMLKLRDRWYRDLTMDPDLISKLL